MVGWLENQLNGWVQRVVVSGGKWCTPGLTLGPVLVVF